MLWKKKSLKGNPPRNAVGELYCDTEFVEYFLFSISIPFFFCVCVYYALVFRKGPSKLIGFCSHRLVCANFFSQLSCFSSRSSLSLHRDSIHDCNARVSAVIRSTSRLSLSRSCFCHSISPFCCRAVCCRFSNASLS